MDFKAFAREVLAEFEAEVNEVNCACNMREEPCSWCWSAGMAIGALEDALAKEP